MAIDSTVFLNEIETELSSRASSIIRIGIAALILLVIGAVIWGATAPISGAVVAEGIVKIDTKRKTLQHFDGGVIKEILVKEGSHVQQGQVLVVLEDAQKSADLTILNDQLDALLVKEARLYAEKNLAAVIRWPDSFQSRKDSKLNELIANEKALYYSKRKTLNDQIELYREGVRQARAAIVGYNEELQAIDQGITHAEEQLKANETLFQQKFIQKTELWNAQHLLMEKRERRGEQAAVRAKTHQQIADLELRVIQAKNEYVQQADDELKETRKLIFEIQERIKPAKGLLARQKITAPLGGQVIDMKVSTIGGVIKPGDAIMDIVPENNELLIEAKADTKDIPRLAVGQTAELELTAYNNRIMPIIPGKVIYISGDAIVDPNPNIPIHYLLHIRADPETLTTIKEKGVRLAPGMPVTAFVQTPARTFFEYLAAPIVDRTRRTFRER